MDIIKDEIIAQLLAQSVLHDRVEDVDVGLPLRVIGLQRILLIPETERGLVRQVHRRVNLATSITLKRHTLREGGIHSRH